MPFKNIYSPVRGLITAVPATELPEEASPELSGVYLRDGEIVSDYGHSAYPTAGVLKTNQLNGIFMRGDQYSQRNGTAHLVVHTTTNAYEYNTTTMTWDCITKGQLLEDCEDAWTASANVTATADSSIKLRGTNSVKLALAAGFTTGLVAYEDISSADLTGETAVHFWIYSTVALTSGQLQLLLDNTSACASPLETLDIPAVAANTWTPVCIAYATPASLGAVVSVGLNATADIGACSIYLDDIRSVLKFTGTADNLFSTAVMNDALLITNGIDQPKKYLGTPANGEATLATNLVSGAITTSEVVVAAKDHVVLFNNTENGADAPQRSSWSNIGQLEDYTGGTAGYQDLVDDESWIISVEQLSENTWAVYKEKSIVLMEWVGGQTPFRFTTMVKGQTISGKASVANIEGTHYIFGTQAVYTYAGGSDVGQLDTTIKRALYGSLDFTYINRAFFVYIPEDDELQLFVPTTTQYPDVAYCFDIRLKIWYKKDRTMTGTGTWISASSLTIGDLVGTIGDQNFTFGSTIAKSNTPIYLVGDSNGQVFKLDKTTLNNNGSAITNEFQTPDFLYPSTDVSKDKQGDILEVLASASQKDGQFRFFRAKQVYLEAKGQSVTVEYSIDGGATWAPCQGDSSNTLTLTSSYIIYQLDFDVVCRKIRFRFRNTTASSGYAIRHFGFYWQPRSTRR